MASRRPFVWINGLLQELPATDTLVGPADTATLAAGATVLATPRTINGVTFDGSANITIAGATPRQHAVFAALRAF